MLPAAHRMRRREDFTATTRRGARARAGSLVLHHLAAPAPLPSAAVPPDPAPPPAPATVGFVVGRSVGNSVVRHRVVRRLRAQTSDLLAVLPAGSRTVVRALPPAAAAGSGALRHDLDSAWSRVTRSVR